MDYVVENNLKVKPTCPYLQDNFLPSHPEYNKYIYSKL